MKAIHKYNTKDKEGARRVAQSLGWRPSIHDMPKMIALLKRAGIEIETHTAPDELSDSFVTDSTMPKAPIADTTELKL